MIVGETTYLKIRISGQPAGQFDVYIYSVKAGD